jgi:hypothetical protein
MDSVQTIFFPLAEVRNGDVRKDEFILMGGPHNEFEKFEM